MGLDRVFGWTVILGGVCFMGYHFGKVSEMPEGSQKKENYIITDTLDELINKVRGQKNSSEEVNVTPKSQNPYPIRAPTIQPEDTRKPKFRYHKPRY